MNGIAAILLAIVPHSVEPVEDFVDVVHLEHFYDERGQLVFSQHIFIDEVLCPGNRIASEVTAWRLVKGQTVNRDARGWYVLWNDGDTLRRVRARSYRETHSQVDSELAAREHLPQCQRRGLKGGK
jgi:hypothetical protein